MNASPVLDPNTDMLDPYPPPPFVPNSLISSLAAANTTLRAKTLREQQAVLSLQALAQQDDASGKVLGDPIAELTDQLVLGAGEDVLELAEGEERQQLRALGRLIERRLSILQHQGNGEGEDGGSERVNGGDVVVLNGAPDGNGNGSRSGNRLGSGSPRGISKSKSRERREVSRGRW